MSCSVYSGGDCVFGCLGELILVILVDLTFGFLEREVVVCSSTVIIEVSDESILPLC